MSHTTQPTSMVIMVAAQTSGAALSSAMETA